MIGLNLLKVKKNFIIILFFFFYFFRQKRMRDFAINIFIVISDTIDMIIEKTLQTSLSDRMRKFGIIYL